MQNPRVKVLYIDGKGRSGSKVLHNALGQVDGLFAGGEMREFWRRVSIGVRPCDCGARVNECAVWRGILDEAFSVYLRLHYEDCVLEPREGAEHLLDLIGVGASLSHRLWMGATSR